MTARYFTPQLFSFLRDLAANNDREWFKAHQDEYERHVREPALDFITAVAAPLAEISPYLAVDARKVGGSLFRIHRDIRFSQDKTPYKTHTGMHFRHLHGGDVHTAGFYVHLQPGHSYMGAGMWRPAASVAQSIRQALAADPEKWVEATRGDKFADVFQLEGDALVRLPRGFEPDHPLIDDLRRKDFAGTAALTQRLVASEDFFDTFVDNCRRAAPLMQFLCDAVGLRF